LYAICLHSSPSPIKLNGKQEGRKVQTPETGKRWSAGFAVGINSLKVYEAHERKTVSRRGTFVYTGEQLVGKERYKLRVGKWKVAIGSVLSIVEGRSQVFI